MDLRNVRKNIENLSDIDLDLKSFEQEWVFSLLSNSNKRLPIDERSTFAALNKLGDEDYQKLDSMLRTFKTIFSKLKYGQFTSHKLHNLSSSLIEMKLANFQMQNYAAQNQDLPQYSSKINHLSSKILGDDFSSLQTIINEVKEFDFALMQAQDIYDEITLFLSQKLDLEDYLAIMALPHGSILRNLKRISTERKTIVKHLGECFISFQRGLENSKIKKQLNLW